MKVASVDMLKLRGIEVGCFRLAACKHGLSGNTLLRLLVAIVERNVGKQMQIIDSENSIRAYLSNVLMVKEKN